jgi:branched-subunit amino acid permease
MFCTQIYMGASNMVFEDLFGMLWHNEPLNTYFSFSLTGP